MNLNDISWLRLSNQQLLKQDFKSPVELVRWMGAMQAQDYNMSKWAMGIRLPGSTTEIINKAFYEGEIVRTHVLRPTWHIVPSEDLVWMIELTSQKIKSSLNSRHTVLGLDNITLDKANKIITSALRGNKHLTKNDLVQHLKDERIALDSSRAYHLLFWAELSGLICSGRPSAVNTTYSLIEEWAPGKGSLSRETSLGKLAVRYFTSHGPAMLKDFSWWSGLSITESRKAIEIAGNKLEKIKVEQNEYWCGCDLLNIEGSTKAYLIPAFDEILISYSDRSAMLTRVDNKKAISSNGFFRPVIVTDGQVSGLWKTTKNKDKIIVEAVFFKRSSKSAKESVSKEVEAYGNFIGRKTEVVFI
ncbi:MAG TPA: winged helix DNA-binding domain-containing protein [Bacteroidales bacterium]|nr:winged helix DNA-binding domain-containing protein [Bacteroidales bacterium]